MPVEATHTRKNNRLIQAPEHPKRYSVVIARFKVINSKITVGQIGYLVKRFATAAYLEQIFAIGNEIAFLEHGQGNNFGKVNIRAKNAFPKVFF